MTNSTDPVLVAGGGIGGLATARALGRRGIPAVVFEQAERPVPERGTGLTLWGNAMRVLAGLGCAEPVVAAGGEVVTNHILSAKGELLMETPIAEISRRVGAPPSYVVRRTDLLGALYGDGTDVDVRTNSETVGYREEANGVTLILADGTEVRGSMLVCADGARSKLRDQLVGDGAAIPVGHPIWRGISDGDPGLGDGIARIVWGPEGGGIGGGRLAGPNISWTISPNSKTQRALDRKEHATPKAALQRFTAGMHPLLEEALAMTPDENIIAAQVRIRKPADTWVSRRVALLGDAAHALPTGFGQGACQALVDADVLTSHLAAEPDVAVALRKYDRERQELFAWLRPKVMLLGKLAGIENRFACAARDFVVKRMPMDKSGETWERLLRVTHTEVPG
jgi:2-polyprenyl-6-methoxyphenol hydroxylase-like FAD-dependent oxidoreductase